ncbi:MAG: helix-turn-helix domain-containing protein [Verrucomicrobiota bacterium JB023]|nr:helix-turn-helix domain-containing protein [Verrucomicrobiota bacterium JB023]
MNQCDSHCVPKSIADEIGLLQPFLDRVEGLRCVVKDAGYRYEFVSDGWLKSVGLDESLEVIGQTVFEVFPVWRAERYHREERRVVEGGEIIDTFEELMMVDGGRREVWRSLKGPRVREGKIVGMVIFGMLVDPEMVRKRLRDDRPEAVRFLERHVEEDWSIADIADRLGMSRRSLERYFRKETGMSPARYRLLCRVTRARNLLQFSRKPLAEIASACGFCDQSHLSRAFAAEHGVTPGRWRERISSRGFTE